MKDISNLKQVLKNFTALSIVQATNYILPLITLPYLIRLLGFDKFGIVSFGLSVAVYLSSVTDYGFNQSATRSVSINRHDKKAISALFYSVIASKAVLFLVCICIVVLLTLFVPRFKDDYWIFYLCLIQVIGNVLSPIWFFQGIEKMKYITFINVISKLLILLLIFIFIDDEADYLYVTGLYGVSYLFAGLLGFVLAIKQIDLEYHRPSIQDIIDQLRSSWHLFTLNFSVIVFSSVNTIILGFFVTNAELGYYSLAEKIAFTVWQLLIVFSQAVYPNMCQLAQNRHHDLVNFLRKTFIPFFLFIFLVSIVMFFAAEYIVLFFAGNINYETVHLVRIMSFFGFITCSNIPAYQTMLAYNFNKSVAKILNTSAVFNIPLAFILIHFYGVEGAAVALIVTQLLLTFSLHYVLEKNYRDYAILKFILNKADSEPNKTLS